MTTTSSATSAAAAYLLQGQPAAATAPDGATPSGPTTGTTAGTADAQTGAAAAKSEPFSAPMLVLPSEPTTADVLTGIQRAMADPATNATTAQRLYEFQQQMLQTQQSMIQAMISVSTASS